VISSLSSSSSDLCASGAYSFVSIWASAIKI
jgi:hypothetical protein